MLKLRALVLVLVMLVLTGCSDHRQPRTVYDDGETVRISRSDSQIRLLDRTEGKEYDFTVRRVKRGQSGTVGAKTILKTNSINVTSVGDIWILETPAGKVYLRW